MKINKQLTLFLMFATIILYTVSIIQLAEQSVVPALVFFTLSIISGVFAYKGINQNYISNKVTPHNVKVEPTVDKTTSTESAEKVFERPLTEEITEKPKEVSKRPAKKNTKKNYRKPKKESDKTTNNSNTSANKTKKKTTRKPKQKTTSNKKPSDKK